MAATYDDDEPIPAHQPPPPPSPSSSLPSATATIATISTVPEYPALIASSSSSSFAILVNVSAPPTPARTRDRTPIDLVAVLDVSGSMCGDKIALVKRAVRFIIHTLGPSDRLSIVSFSNKSKTVIGLTCMTENGQSRAAAAVAGLFAGGGTNIKEGLEKGVRVLEKRRYQNPVAGIILLSDGQDTTRYWSPGMISHNVPGQQKEVSSSYSYLLPSNKIAPVHTFGFGSDHDPRAMHTIANATGGTFSFIEDERDVQDAFAMCIGGLLSVVAQKAELMVKAASGVHIDSISSGSYQSRILGHGVSAVIEFGDLYAEEEKDILVYVKIPAIVGSQEEIQLLTVKAYYKEPLTQELVNVEGKAAVIRRPEHLSPEDGVINLKVDRQRNRLLVGESIKEAQERAERGDFEGAKGVLSSRRAELLGSASAGDELCGWLESELAEIHERMANRRVYMASGRAYALAGMEEHMMQRAAGGATRNRASVYFAVRAKGAKGSKASHRRVGYQTRAMGMMVKKSKKYGKTA